MFPLASFQDFSNLQNLAIAGMVLQGFLEHGDGFAAAAARMQRDRVDIGVPRTIRLQFGRPPKLGERRVRLLQPRQCKAERVVGRSVARCNLDCAAQGAFSFGIAAELPIEIGQIDRRHDILGA